MPFIGFFYLHLNSTTNPYRMKPIAILLLISFIPLSIHLSAFTPRGTTPLVIADKKEFRGGKLVQLSFKPKIVQIVFDTNNENSRNLTYEVELQGLGCAYRTNEPVARYTFLPGGEHRFMYRFFQNGVVSPWFYQDIRIKRGIEEMPWFYPIALTCLFLILGVITYFWILYNFRQKLKIQALRSKISANLHDETGSTLSSISFDLGTLSNLLPDENEDAKTLIAETRNTADEAVLKLRDTLWSIQPEHDDLQDLMGRIGQSATKMFAFKPIVLNIKNELSNKDNFQIAMERRGDILHIAKEALNNTIKHAKATNVDLLIVPIKNGVELSIVDNGIGFDPDNPQGEGNGLRNFQQRAKESFLEVVIRSKLDEGTAIIVTIPRL